mmetsp:Transcript_29955/g.70473  ORF Transcript_29955/g.70473 Transcript_29955/m.70473 type:complete len:211 (+) Transcript_29955:150-782(+)
MVCGQLADDAPSHVDQDARVTQRPYLAVDILHWPLPLCIASHRHCLSRQHLVHSLQREYSLHIGGGHGVTWMLPRHAEGRGREVGNAHEVEGGGDAVWVLRVKSDTEGLEIAEGGVEVAVDLCGEGGEQHVGGVRGHEEDPVLGDIHKAERPGPVLGDIDTARHVVGGGRLCGGAGGEKEKAGAELTHGDDGERAHCFDSCFGGRGGGAG